MLSLGFRSNVTVTVGVFLCVLCSLAAIQSNEKLDFLEGVVDATAVEASAAKKPKKAAGSAASSSSTKKKSSAAADDEDPIGSD
jgi:hypothetical protein